MDREAIKQSLKTILQNHQGKSRAIRRDKLWSIVSNGHITSSDDRHLRELITEIIHEGTPVLFSTGNPGGYYLPENVKELQEGIENRQKLIVGQAQVMRDLKIYGKRYLTPEQKILI